MKSESIDKGRIDAVIQKMKAKNADSKNKIIAMNVVDEGRNKVILTEYENGAKTYIKLRPPMSVGRRSCIAIAVAIVLLILFATMLR